MDTFINVIGFSAGLLVAASLLPQIWRAHKRESAEDLSFFWQASDRTHARHDGVYGSGAFLYNLLRKILRTIYLDHTAFCRSIKETKGRERERAGISNLPDELVVVRSPSRKLNVRQRKLHSL